MDTIFMNSEISKTYKPRVLILKLTNKLDLRIGEKIIAFSNLSIFRKTFLENIFKTFLEIFRTT